MLRRRRKRSQTIREIKGKSGDNTQVSKTIQTQKDRFRVKQIQFTVYFQATFETKRGNYETTKRRSQTIREIKRKSGDNTQVFKTIQTPTETDLIKQKVLETEPLSVFVSVFVSLFVSVFVSVFVFHNFQLSMHCNW